MKPQAIEQRNVSLTGYHDLDGRPGFKLAIQEVEGRWFLYVAHLWHSGWTILDVTDPERPEHVRFVEGPPNTNTIQIQVADGKMITSLEKPIPGWDPVDGPTRNVDQRYEEGIYVWDVETDPTRPERLGQFETGGHGTHRNHYDGGDYVYLSAGPEGFTGKALVVVDISDPTDPTEVSRWWWPGQAPDDPEPADETYYFHGPAYVEGDRAYLAYGTVGMVTLDISDVTEPTLLNRLDFGDLGSWLGVHSAVSIPGTDCLAVNNEAILEGDREPLNYAFLVDVSDDKQVGFNGKEPTGPRVVSWLPTPTPEDGLPYENYYRKGGRFGPHNQHHYQSQPEHLRSEEYLFMTYFNAGLRVYDISDPLAPTEAGYYVPEDPDERVGTKPEGKLLTQFEDVLVDARGYVYCTDKNHGLHILETGLL